MQLNRRNVVQNIAMLLSGSIVAQGMTAMSLLLTARQLGVADYGQYVSCFILASFSSIVFSLGMDLWLLREGGRNPTLIQEAVGSVLVIKLILSVGWLITMLALSHYINNGTFPANLLKLAIVSTWLDILFNTPLTAFKASLRNHFTSLLEGGADTVWFVATLILIASGERRVMIFIWARIITQGIFLLISLVLVWYVVRLRPNIITIRKILLETFPFAASEFLAWTSMRIDVLIVALLLGKTEVGQYSPAVGVINAAFLIPAAVHLVITPVLSNLFMTNLKQGWLTAKRSLILLLVIGSAMSLILFIFAGPFMGILGKSFESSHQILQILSVILLIHSLCYGLAAILVAANLQKQRTVIQCIAAGTNIMLNLLVLRWTGIRGAAMVYVITEVILFSGYGWLVWTYWKTNIRMPTQMITSKKD